MIAAGPGRERAAAAARRWSERGVAGLVSWGCAAGLGADARPGNLCLPTRIVSAAGESLVDPAWHGDLCSRLAGEIDSRVEPLAEAGSVLQTAEQKSALARATGAWAADMESMAIGEVAADCGIPFLAVRVIADTLDTPIPSAALAVLDADGVRHPARILPYLLIRPRLVLDLLRLGRSFRAACATLTAVRRAAGPGLCLPPVAG